MQGEDAYASFVRGHRLLTRGGRLVDAEAAYRRAIAGGHTEAWAYLGLLLCGRPGRDPDAEAAFRAAMSCGHSALAARAALELGHMLDKLHGDSAGARDCFEFALTHGSGHDLESATVNLAFLLAEEDDRQRATAMFRSVIVRRYESASIDVTNESGRHLAVPFAALAVWNPSRALLRHVRKAVYRGRRLRGRLLAAGFPTQRPGPRPNYGVGGAAAVTRHAGVWDPGGGWRDGRARSAVSLRA